MGKAEDANRAASVGVGKVEDANRAASVGVGKAEDMNRTRSDGVELPEAENRGPSDGVRANRSRMTDEDERTKTNVRNQADEGITMGQILKVDQNRPDDSVLARAAEVLRKQGVLVMPTDSVYGIGCAAIHGNPARERVFRIKERPADMTLPWLIADTADLARYGENVPSWALALTANFWPGALTVVVRASDRVPDEYQRADTHTIALRMPDSELVRELARQVRKPLAVTSANTHGAAAATSGASVEARLVEDADLTLDAGPAPIAIASTIVDCTGTEPRILREGAIPTADILRVASL